MRENPWLPNNSYLNEVITACQYPCIAAVQRPYLCEPEMVTTMKFLLQNSKALGRRNGQTKVVDQPKLPPHSNIKIVYKADTLISKGR